MKVERSKEELEIRTALKLHREIISALKKDLQELINPKWTTENCIAGAIGEYAKGLDEGTKISIISAYGNNYFMGGACNNVFEMYLGPAKTQDEMIEYLNRNGYRYIGQYGEVK